MRDDAVLEPDRVEDEAVDEVCACARQQFALTAGLCAGLLDLYGESARVRDSTRRR